MQDTGAADGRAERSRWTKRVWPVGVIGTTRIGLSREIGPGCEIGAGCEVGLGWRSGPGCEVGLGWRSGPGGELGLGGIVGLSRRTGGHGIHVSRSARARLGLRAEFRMVGSFPVIRGFLLADRDFRLGGGVM